MLGGAGRSRGMVANGWQFHRYLKINFQSQRILQIKSVSAIGSRHDGQIIFIPRLKRRISFPQLSQNWWFLIFRAWAEDVTRILLSNSKQAGHWYKAHSTFTVIARAGVASRAAFASGPKSPAKICAWASSRSVGEVNPTPIRYSSSCPHLGHL